MKTITINSLTMGQTSSYYTIKEAYGFDSADLEIVRFERPGFHGEKIPRAFWRARVMRLLIGIKSTTIADYNTKRRALLNAFDLPRSGLTTMQFTTTDDLDLQCDVQLAGKIDAPLLRGEVTMAREVWIPLIAEDPNLYSQTLSQDDITFAAGSGIVNNGGNTPTYPTIRVYGDVSGTIAITNTTLGATVSFSGLSLGAAEYMDIDMLDETVVKNNGDNLYEYIVSDDFWWLAEGDNTITISATVGGSGDRKITLSYRDTYVGV